MQIVRSKSKMAAMILPVVPSAIKERSIVKTGDVFIRSWMIERMPRSVQVEETQYESWVDGSCFEFWWEASNADANEIEHELGNLGWLFFSTGSVIETSAFGCDSSVLERALSRALQKAADQGINAVEIVDITVDHDSWMTYVSMLARPRELQKCAVLDSNGAGACFSTREVEDESLAA